jgi:hypothetical protein
MANPLDRIEERIEQFVEGALSRLIGIQISAVDVAAQLARALSEGVRRTEEGKPFAPDKYALTFHPEDAQTLLEKAPDLHGELSQGLLEVARECEYLVFRDPVVTIAVDPTLRPRQLRVVAWHSTAPLEFTQTMQREPKTNPGALPSGAYLIVEGNRHFPLDRPVVNIGRRLDNHIILDDPRVSRTHAQIRIRNGRFEIFDLGSSAGTLVNGQDVRQHMLQTGDVIELAGTRLVYGEDPGGPPDETPAYSPPFPPKPSGDQRTRITPRNNDEKS